MTGAWMELVRGLDWSPLWISLKTGIAATAISFFLGLAAARRMMARPQRVRSVIDGILTLPMVLPPTAAGFLLLLLFSRRRPAGIFLEQTFGIRAVHTWLGCVIAATVIAFPLMYRSVRAALEQVDPELVYAARTLGMPERAIFWRVVMPSAQPGILSGTVLAFARAMGEYGATSMLAGNIPGRTGTISQKIAMVLQDGNYPAAGFWVAVMIAISFICVVLINLLSGIKSRSDEKW